MNPGEPVKFDPALFQENERTVAAEEDYRIAGIGPMQTETGGHLPSVQIAYQTWGSLNAERDNAILICHALSGNSNAASWWDRLVGPGRALDTDRYFLICSNVLGGCNGSTGPASPSPDGGRYGSRFPIITVGDMVDAQAQLLDHLGIDRLLAAVGGSMGGMQALEWSVRYPQRVSKVIGTATCARHSPMQIALNEVGRQAILRDPKWRGGDYPPEDPPVSGLSVARMLGHVSFLSAEAFEAKFSRRLQGKDRYDYHLGVEFEVESYLSYQGDKFTKRFDANSLLLLTRAIDYYEWTGLERSVSEYLFVSYVSDWLYTTAQAQELEMMARRHNLPVRRIEVDLPYGHDAFLLDGERQGQVISEFLSK